MKVRFTERALAYLRSEQSYLARYDKRAAKAMALQIRHAARLIADYPQAAPENTAVAGVRRYMSPPYHIDYVIAGDTIIVIAIRHGRQNTPELSNDDETFDGDA